MMSVKSQRVVQRLAKQAATAELEKDLPNKPVKPKKPVLQTPNDDSDEEDEEMSQHVTTD
jgi:hypothetical protein